jgi:hypothetical protein
VLADSPATRNQLASRSGDLYTGRAVPYIPRTVERVNVTLDEERSQKLSRLAERMHVQPGTVARSLLASRPSTRQTPIPNVVALLDAIPGA